MAELTLEESIRQIFPTLPVPIQKFFAQNKLGGIVRTLMERYALHIDQGAILEREVLSALLGIKGPDEIANALYTELPISKQTVLDIIADLNKEIFVPLRAEEMKSGTGKTLQPAVPTAPPAAPRPVSGTQSSSHFHLENKITPPATGPSQGSVMPKLVPPPRPINLAPTAPGGRPALRDVLAAITKTPLPSPQLRQGYDGHSKATEGTAKPMGGNKMLEDHEEPHIEFKKPLPPNLPGALPPRPVAPKVEFPVVPPAIGLQKESVPPKPIPLAVPVPPKPYSGDPYREPIE